MGKRVSLRKYGFVKGTAEFNTSYLKLGAVEIMTYIDSAAHNRGCVGRCFRILRNYSMVPSTEIHATLKRRGIDLHRFTYVTSDEYTQEAMDEFMENLKGAIADLDIYCERDMLVKSLSKLA